MAILLCAMAPGLLGCQSPPPSILGRWSGKLDDPATPVADTGDEATAQLEKVTFEYVFQPGGALRIQTTTPHTKTVTKATWREAPGEGGWRIIEILPRGHQVVTGRLKIRFLSDNQFQLESDMQGHRTSTFTRQAAMQLDASR